ncbi:IclR family transcriptional regulator [Brachybacterium sp. AOP42-C2-15]|uniref:IclR family transcriptional regulator n=1 Tax=Brachybacterium sp. AOP42-C2-15 TaxID=3457670 RepID=UPI004034D84C
MNTTRVRSADRVMDILLLLAEHPSGLATAVIAEPLDIPKSTLHHLLNTMADRGFVGYSPELRVWTIGPAAFSVGVTYVRTSDLPRAAAPFLRSLCEAHGATAHLAVLSGMEAVYVAKFETSGPGPRLVTEVGARLPAHLTAVGRVLLAALKDREISDLYPAGGLDRRTGAGPVDRIELADLLAEVRRSGYADELGATTPGIRCIAAPVRIGHVTVAALGLTFVDGVRSPEELTSLTEDLRRISDELSVAVTPKGGGHDPTHRETDSGARTDGRAVRSETADRLDAGKFEPTHHPANSAVTG